MTNAKRTIMFGTPSHGVAPPQAMAYREDLMFRMGGWAAKPDCPFQFMIGVVPDMLVQFSREELAKRAVGSGCDYLFMIDDDMIGPIDLIERLLEADVDIIAPLAFTRQPPHPPVVYAQRGGWMVDSPYHHIETNIVRNYPKDRLFECDAVGFGAVLMKTSVLKKMEQPWFFNMWGTKGTGEDIYFCLKAGREARARVFCDSRLKMGHLAGESYIGEDDYERLNPEIGRLREVSGEWTREKSGQHLIA